MAGQTSTLGGLGLGDAALELAGGLVFGWSVPVFPLQPRGKQPLTAHGFKDASADRERIGEWWARTPEANIGLPTGRTSGLLVVDLDGEEGASSWGELLSRNPGTPPETGARTGGGGWHLFWKMPDAPIGNSARKLGPGIDVRGDGGYVVLAPSLHSSGAAYEWLSHPERWPVPDAPSWLVEALTRRETAAQAVPATPPRFDAGVGTRYGLAALREELERLAVAPEGERNATLNAVAFAVGQLAGGGELDDEQVVPVLVRAGRDIGLTEGEVIATVRSGTTAGREQPRSAPRLQAA